MTKATFAPFAALEIPFSSIPTADTPEYASFISHYITSAFSFIRATPEWKKTKSFKSPVGGPVRCKVLPSQVKKLGKKAWHLRESSHGPDCGLTYDDFRRYIRFQHSIYEKEYIEDVVLTECAAKVKEDEAEIWHNSYFVQMLLTIDLPPHPQPYSQDHEQATLAWIRDPSRTLIPPTCSNEPEYRSLVVLQFPVSHPDHPQTAPKVRAVYSSFEAIYEGPAPKQSQYTDAKPEVVNWKMAVQSDTRGRIPTMMQEMAMPGEIAHDVPAFIGWAKKYKVDHPPADE
uniref:DUF3074 domain-containing protein n=1 Tax=Melanopsichium pennsylvanicum 4 TaxID=1398559 RepID=A0A077R1V3_9BASI|nr:conserved hypothetical protein [Melanopsichium pennsylvanicum 4]